MTTYVYFCVTDQEIADAKAACVEHGCPNDQIQELGPARTFAYEGDMEPLVD